jgi:cell division ATPase FtsA
MPVKIGIPSGFSGGLVREIENPAYSTAVGLVYHGLKYQDKDSPAGPENKKGRKSMSGMVGRMREWFDQL